MRLLSLVGSCVTTLAICVALASRGPGSSKAVNAKKAKLLGAAALMYANDWDGVTPWVENQTILRMEIDPYAEGLEKSPTKQGVEDIISALSKLNESPPRGPAGPPPQPWRLIRSSNPRGGELLFNLRVGGVNLAKLGTSKKNAILFYDSKAWPDGSRTVAFANGQVAQVSRSKWKIVGKSLRKRYPRAARRPLPKDWHF